MTTAEVNPATLSGLVSDQEGRALAEIAGRLNQWQIVVEIGSYTGKSTCYLAEATSQPVIAIDLWDLKLPGEKKKRNKHKYDVKFNSTAAWDIFSERTSRYGNVTSIRGESREVAKMWNLPRAWVPTKLRIGLLFIDGAHDYASVKGDYESFASFIDSGGWLAMHDATPGSKVDKVIQDVVTPSGLWGERRQVDRLAVFQRLEA